jgi:hypothetical protein
MPPPEEHELPDEHEDAAEHEPLTIVTSPVEHAEADEVACMIGITT